MKRYVLLFTLLALALSLPSLDTIDRYLLDGYEVLDHKFGALHLNKVSLTGTDNIVVWPKLGFFTEKEHFEAYYKQLLHRQSKPLDLSTAIEECAEGSWPDFFKFAPTFVGAAIPGGSAISYSAPCFGENTIQATLIGNSTVQLVHTVGEAADELCQDAYVYTTTQNFHFTSIFFNGTHTTTFANIDVAQLEEIQETGILIFRFCDKLMNDFPDVMMTALLFLGGFSTNPNIPIFGSYPPFWMVDLNIDFIQQATGYQWEERPVEAQKTIVQLNKSLIQSGDFFAVTRFDGLDQIIEYGAGSHSGHSTMALRVDGELYVAESQPGWNWPRSGIQMNM
jgi:hypothetical protein